MMNNGILICHLVYQHGNKEKSSDLCTLGFQEMTAFSWNFDFWNTKFEKQRTGNSAYSGTLTYIVP